jgi:hypothetical protein
MRDVPPDAGLQNKPLFRSNLMSGRGSIPGHLRGPQRR